LDNGGALSKQDYGKFVQFFRQASPYIEGHRGRTFVVVIPGEVSCCNMPWSYVLSFWSACMLRPWHPSSLWLEQCPSPHPLYVLLCCLQVVLQPSLLQSIMADIGLLHGEQRRCQQDSSTDSNNRTCRSCSNSN
jgi:hypothetical protein